MITATVVGSLWSTRRLAELPTGAFLEVEVDRTSQRLVAFDVLGSGVGERVSRRSGLCGGGVVSWQGAPIDALIVGSIDPPSHGGDARRGHRPMSRANSRLGAVPHEPIDRSVGTWSHNEHRQLRRQEEEWQTTQ